MNNTHCDLAVRRGLAARQVLTIASLCAFSAWLAAADVAFAAYTVSRGRQLLLDRGLDIQALGAWGSNYGWPPADSTQVALWENSNFRSPNFWYYSTGTQQEILSQLPAGTTWSRMYNPYLLHPDWPPAETSYDYVRDVEKPYINSFIGSQYSDEMTAAQLSDTVILDDMKAAYATWKTLYPKAMAFTNFAGGPAEYEIQGTTLTNYMNHTQPDMLYFDAYPNTLDTFSNRTIKDWYSYMSRYRAAALAGYTDASTGENTGPLPYGQFTKLLRSSYTAGLPSESFIRLQENASWAFGYTSITGFVYNVWSPPVMFNEDRSKTLVYDYVAETNRQSRNLSPALVRLVSTGIFMKPGSGGSVSGTGISQWYAGVGGTSRHDDYITGIMPYTNSTANGGGIDSSYSDILVGYFEPLLSDNGAHTFADGLHFMIVNGSRGTDFAYNSTTGDPATNSSQWYHLTFDFSGSDFDALARLSRDTGLVEAVPLIYISGSQYYLDLNLPGGTGDLFVFWDSSMPLPTIPEPSALALAGIGLIGVLVYALRKRK